jgi:hypothetical protein
LKKAGNRPQISNDPVPHLPPRSGRGDESALAQLMPLVDEELHRLARRRMRGERRGHLLQTTALVNEAYVRLIDLSRVRWQDRAHLIAMAARLMRHFISRSTPQRQARPPTR